MTDKRCCPTNDGPAKTPYTATGELIPGEGYLVGPANATAGIVVISDIFGMLPISMRFADTLAAAGYRVFMPDFFGEKAWSESNMPIDFESAEWGEFFKIAFNFDLHRPTAIAAVQRLRAGGCAKVATVGMCWGALLSFQLAGMEKMLDAVSSAHPSRLSAEAVQQSTVPICILNSKDEPPSEDIEAAMQKHTFAAKNVYHRYSTLSHGFFGARFDYDAATPEQVKEMDEALVKIKAFFQANLH